MTRLSRYLQAVLAVALTSIAFSLSLAMPAEAATTAGSNEPEYLYLVASSGDVNCSGYVDPVDALLILQFTAALLDSLTCPANADTNLDSEVDALDGALVLQFVAGLVPSLPSV